MKKILFLSLTIASMVFLASCSDSSSTTTDATSSARALQNVGVAEFKKLVDNKAGTLIDVRTPREYQAGAIPGTKLNIDVRQRNFKGEMDKLDKDKTYLVYCRSGGRSRQATEIMESMGFKHIINLKRGFMSWQKAGY